MKRDLFDRSISKDCRVCGAPALARSYVCKRCRTLKDRLETRKGWREDSEARLWAMFDQWDRDAGAFRCKYTGVALSETHGTRRYATWEHATPGNESSVVLVADLVNKMKSDMTEEQFHRMVKALARRFDGLPFEDNAFPPDV